MSCECESTRDLACSLGPEELRERLTYIRALTRRQLRERRRDGLRLVLAYDAEAEPEVRTLVALEEQCCAFPNFTMRTEDCRFIVTIVAPPAAADLIEEIFSEFSGEGGDASGVA